MRGVIYALLATISYSSVPTFTQVGYRAGIQTDTLLFFRHVVSLICLIPSVIKKETFAGIGKAQIPGLLFLSVFSIIGNLSFNYAYHYLPNMVSVSVSISYVIFVFILEILLGREAFTKKRGGIIALTFLGLILIAAPGSEGMIDMKAFLVGIFASFQYAVQLIAINSKKLKHVHANVIVLCSVIPIILFAGTRCLIYSEPLLPGNAMQWFSVVALGTIGVIFSRGLFFRAMRLIGATKASMIDSLEPFSSAILGWFFLGQGLNAFIVIGSILMMASVMLLLMEKQSSETT